MKNIKLILAFIAILAIVIVAFMRTSPDSYIDMTVIPDETYQEYRFQIEDDWKNKNDWDESLYRLNIEIINQLSKTYNNTTPLKDLNSSSAIEIIETKLLHEWKKSTCKKSVIDKYINAKNIICSLDENAKSNKLIVDINDIYRVYEKAYNIVYTILEIHPNFDGRTWNKFDDDELVITIRKDQQEILNNNIYKTKLANISDISYGLNNIHVKISKCRDAFYGELALQIEDYYNNIAKTERTRTQLNSLRNARNNYEAQYISSQALNNLAKNFAADVEKNESNIN